MKFLFCFLWLLLVVSQGIAQDNNAETKAQINKIKKSSTYLYGEATLPMAEDALELAKELLSSEIDAWIQEKKKLRTSDNVVVKNVSELSQQMTLPRGNMHRAFVYVKKDDIIPSDNATVINNQKQNGGSIPESVIEVENSAESERQTVEGMVLSEILKLHEFSQLKNCLTTLKQEGKISDYDKYSNIKTPSDYYLIIYNRQGMIEAVLEPGKDNRKNLKTNGMDNVSNYKGRGAIGFKF
ncbi:hypothetical protein I6E11_11575 [Bacteroides caecigallinarum]|uniref:hypothetical protein n=1 Tax=Bacteroides caecigallinarum TaxID=1411144 RepID=UPI001F27B009|nr:hypothetical protein [Bacteroides caecigallinarum]MCF2594413.1 hypothetical protein [Bacteroides caecigallinarum]